MKMTTVKANSCQTNKQKQDVYDAPNVNIFGKRWKEFWKMQTKEVAKYNNFSHTNKWNKIFEIPVSLFWYCMHFKTSSCACNFFIHFHSFSIIISISCNVSSSSYFHSLQLIKKIKKKKHSYLFWRIIINYHSFKILCKKW